MRHAPAVQGVGQGADQRVLADQLRQALRPISARQDPVGARGLFGRATDAGHGFCGHAGHQPRLDGGYGT